MMNIKKRREWLGILNTKDETGGVHINYLHSKYQNLINYNDCTKFSLKVELDGYFPGYYKGQIIPVMIEVAKSSLRGENTGNTPPGEKNTSGDRKIDNFLICIDTVHYLVVHMQLSVST